MRQVSSWARLDRIGTLPWYVWTLTVVLWSIAQHAGAQTIPSLDWDEDPAAIVNGYAVTVDGFRTDYGLTPTQADGSCACSIPLPFTSGKHTVIVSAYNSAGETASAPLIVGPVAN